MDKTIAANRYWVDVASKSFDDAGTTVENAFLAGIRWHDENPGWISVEERLPDDDCRILAYPNTVAEVGTALFWKETGMWQDLEDHTEPWKPQYWMPIPPAPKDVKNED